MKKILVSLAMIAAVFAGCQKSEMADPSGQVEQVETQFVAVVEDFDAETRTSMDSNRAVLWSSGDHIAIFKGSTLGEEFALEDESAGQTNGTFNRVKGSDGNTFFAGTEIPCNIGFYPYASNLSLAGKERAYEIRNVKLPARQTYTPATFANGAFPMVAFNGDVDGRVLEFKNVLGVIKLQFKGNALVSSVKIEGKNNEVLSGTGAVTVYTNNQTPGISMAGTGDDDKSVTLECPSIVQLSETEATDFLIAVPPVTFSNGFKVTITDIYGNTQTLESTVENVVPRSTVLAMPEVSVTFDYPDEQDFDITLSVENEVEGVNPQLPQFERMNIAVAYSGDFTPTASMWKSSDPSLLTVTPCEGGAVVEAIYDGMMTDDDKKSVTITHYVGTKTATKTIDITRAVPKSIEFVGLPENNTLYLGEGFGPDFRAVVHPEQASQHVAFIGTDGFGSVAYGDRTAFKTGYFELTAQTSYIPGWGEVKETVYITVKARLVESGSLSNPTLTLAEGESAVLAVDFTPANDDNYDYSVVWKSSDETVATVEEGKVTAVAEGTATVSATLSNGDVLTCEVTVQQPVAASVFVGDFYYSDGTWSTELDPSKTPIGIVFSVDNPTQMGDAKLAADHPEATHGLVVSLTETANILWQTEAKNVGQWLADNTGYNDLQNTTRKCGYSNTIGLQAYNAFCEEANKVLVADCSPEIELGTSTSGWYLPSYAELMMLFEYEQSTRSIMISNGAIANKIVEAGGTPFSIIRYSYDTPDGSQDAPSYWASTESSTSATWGTCVHFLHGGQTNRSKTAKTYYIARYIFAF